MLLVFYSKSHPSTKSSKKYFANTPSIFFVLALSKKVANTKMKGLQDRKIGGSGNGIEFLKHGVSADNKREMCSSALEM